MKLKLFVKIYFDIFSACVYLLKKSWNKIYSVTFETDSENSRNFKNEKQVRKGGSEYSDLSNGKKNDEHL